MCSDSFANERGAYGPQYEVATPVRQASEEVPFNVEENEAPFDPPQNTDVAAQSGIPPTYNFQQPPNRYSQGLRSAGRYSCG